MNDVRPTLLAAADNIVAMPFMHFEADPGLQVRGRSVVLIHHLPSMFNHRQYSIVYGLITLETIYITIRFGPKTFRPKMFRP